MESQQDFIHIIVHTTSHGNPSTENKFFFFFSSCVYITFNHYFY